MLKSDSSGIRRDGDDRYDDEDLVKPDAGD